MKVLAVLAVVFVGIVTFACASPNGSSHGQSNPPIVTPQVETEAGRRTRLCEAALQGGNSFGISEFCTEAPKKTPPPPVPPADLAAWCWNEKAYLALNQIAIDANKAGGYDFRAAEEEQVTQQRKLESTCGSYGLVPTPSDGLDKTCQFGLDNEYRARQAGQTFQADQFSWWHDAYCR